MVNFNPFRRASVPPIEPDSPESETENTIINNFPSPTSVNSSASVFATPNGDDTSDDDDTPNFSTPNGDDAEEENHPDDEEEEDGGTPNPNSPDSATSIATATPNGQEVEEPAFETPAKMSPVDKFKSSLGKAKSSLGKVKRSAGRTLGRWTSKKNIDGNEITHTLEGDGEVVTGLAENVESTAFKRKVAMDLAEFNPDARQWIFARAEKIGVKAATDEYIEMDEQLHANNQNKWTRTQELLHEEEVRTVERKKLLQKKTYSPSPPPAPPVIAKASPMGKRRLDFDDDGSGKPPAKPGQL
ncbi:MAG: hypothetical protein SGILL_006370, partial [Bacillariaceae sp.]